jgi:hypothetical protein
VVVFIDYDVEALSNVVVNVEPMTTIAPQPTKVDLTKLGKLNNVSQVSMFLLQALSPPHLFPPSQMLATLFSYKNCSPPRIYKNGRVKLVCLLFI